MLHSLKYLRVRTKVAKIQGDQKNRGLEFLSPFNPLKLLKTVPQHIVFCLILEGVIEVSFCRPILPMSNIRKSLY